MEGYVPGGGGMSAEEILMVTPHSKPYTLNALPYTLTLKFLTTSLP
jgi:hypothetical protein